APGGAPALSERLDVAPGYELALAAALDDRLRAAVVDDLPAGSALLDRAGAEGGRALVAGSRAPVDVAGSEAAAFAEGASSAPGAPLPGAERLLDHVRGEGSPLALARTLLADAWVVERLEDVPDDFAGIAVTRSGRAWFGGWRELRQAPEGGEDRLLAQRNRRDELRAATERAASV